MSSSVLKRKLDAKFSASTAIRSMSSVWDDISRSFLKTYKAATAMNFQQKGFSLDKISFEKLQLEVSGKFPVYLLASKGLSDLGFIYYSPEATSAITNKKLGSGEGGDAAGDAVAPGLLDLLLLQPLAQDIIGDIETAFSAHDVDGMFSGLVINERLLSFKEIEGIDEDTDLLHVLMTFKDKDGEGEVTLGMCLHYNIVEKLSIAIPNSLSANLIDVSDPWLSHMYGITLDSRLPLKVILENCTMSIGDCSRLQLGETISLAGSSLEALEVQAETNDGPVNIGKAVLGVYKQNKAVKFLEDPNNEFISDLATLIVR